VLKFLHCQTDIYKEKQIAIVCASFDLQCCEFLLILVSDIEVTKELYTYANLTMVSAHNSIV
jgi:hypothetical protein